MCMCVCVCVCLRTVAISSAADGGRSCLQAGRRRLGVLRAAAVRHCPPLPACLPTGTPVVTTRPLRRPIVPPRSGTVEVSQDGRVLTTLREGVGFGELALLDDGGDSKRTATITAASRCLLGCLSKKDYDALVKKGQQEELQHIVSFFRGSSFFREQRTDSFLHLARVSEHRQWLQGEAIFVTGDPVLEVFFLQEGQVALSKDVYCAPSSSVRTSSSSVRRWPFLNVQQAAGRGGARGGAAWDWCPPPRLVDRWVLTVERRAAKTAPRGRACRRVYWVAVPA
jgi:hypothetical protein